MKTSWMLAIVAATVIAITCSQATEDRATTSPDDMVAVARMVSSFDTFAANEDIESFLAYVADDAVMMPPGEPAVVGVQAIRAWYTAFYASFRSDMTHESLEVDAFGDIIIARGNATGTLTPKAGGAPMPFDNKYLFVLRRLDDGSLQVWRAVFNANTQ
jgi:ketosteroid isomerase-like protein